MKYLLCLCIILLAGCVTPQHSNEKALTQRTCKEAILSTISGNSLEEGKFEMNLVLNGDVLHIATNKTSTGGVHRVTRKYVRQNNGRWKLVERMHDFVLSEKIKALVDAEIETGRPIIIEERE